MRTILFPFLFVFGILNAQVGVNLKAVVLDDIKSLDGSFVHFRKGDKIEVITISKTLLTTKYQNEKAIREVDFSSINNLSFTYNTIEEFWKVSAIKYGSYEFLFDDGFQIELRGELEQDAVDFHNFVRVNNLLFKDDFIETHLYSLIVDILPQNKYDGRPGNISVSILKDSNPNAFIFPNGSMYITTGLLSLINSDEELQAILIHESAHFMLDHQIVNIIEAKKRKKRSEFWAAFATGMAAAADIYMASNNDYYTPGILSSGAAVLSYSITTAINQQMGLEYNRAQEMEADLIARDLFKLIGKSPGALSSALEKIKQHALRHGNTYVLSDNGTHPNIDTRIDSLGIPVDIIDTVYDVRISLVNTYNAIMEYNARRFDDCATLVFRNIKAGVATEYDYLLLAMTHLYLHNSKEKNEEALTLIRKAKNLNVVPTMDLYKQEALVLLRLQKKQEAEESLRLYFEGISHENERLKQVLNPQEWLRINNYLINELEWTKQMLNKVSKL